MRRIVFSLLFVLAASQAAAQAPPTPDKLTVFLDCQNVFCDRNYLITELPYILLTQDRLDAEVHALITGLSTGAGGEQLTIALLGQRRFAGRVDTLTANIPPNSTEDQYRQELARVLKLGLTPFLLRTTAAARMSLSYRALPGDSTAGGTRGIVDPWNFWVYRLSGNGNVGAQSRASNYFVELNASANRITEDWKIIFDAEWEYNSNTFKLDSSTVSFALRSAEFEAVALKSVTPHWSTGAGLNIGIDEFRNQDFNASLDLAAEWNYFPWSEATRRQLVFIAGVSNRYFDYTEETLYERTSEWRTALVSKVAAETRQPWGSLFAGVEHIRYLHASDIYSATLYFHTDVRVSRGFSVYFGGNASKVNDQLYLPRGDAEDDEVLTSQRELATAYRVNFYAGLSFTFGSIFNNVVNPRFNQYP
jgi:hypothetical protein